jgi:TfoX/Sxy family transcriptional regulator of competence genes
MAYDEALAQRIREALAGTAGLSERKMFGGIAFMVNGNMACGIVGDDLMVRVGPDNHDEALGQAHARPMDFNGRPMRGMVYIEPAGTTAAAALRSWLDRGVAFSTSLPPK